MLFKDVDSGNQDPRFNARPGVNKWIFDTNNGYI